MKLGRSNGKILKRNGKLCRGCCESVPVVFLARACPSDGVCSTPPTDDILVIDPEATCADGSPVGGTGDQIIRYNGWCYSIDSVPTRAEDAPTNAPILTGVVGECFERCRPDVVGDEGSCFSEFRYVFYPLCPTAVVNESAPAYVALCADNAVPSCSVVYLSQLNRCYRLDPDLAVFANTLDGAVPSYLDLTQEGLSGPTYPNCCQCATENDVSFDDDASGCDRVTVSVGPCRFSNGVDNRLRCCFGGRPGATATVTWTARRFQRTLGRRTIINPSTGDDCYPENGLAVDTDIETYGRTVVATYGWSEVANNYLLSTASGTETITELSIFREYASGCNNGETLNEQTNILDANDAPGLFSLDGTLFFYDFNNDYLIMDCLSPGQALGVETRDDGAGCVGDDDPVSPNRVETKIAQADYTCLGGTASMRFRSETYGRDDGFAPPDCLVRFVERELDSTITVTFSNEDCSGLCGVAAPITSEGFF